MSRQPASARIGRQPRPGSLAELAESIIGCERCPRLRAYCRAIARAGKREFAGEEYWARPVPSFGDPRARLLIVGLAPAAHGANRTGQMFTGDSSGNWLYEALHRYGWSNRPKALRRNDGLVLTDCRITAAAHCAPPDNKPTRELVTSFHPSQQNTNTGKLTRAMWYAVFERIRRILGQRQG